MKLYLISNAKVFTGAVHAIYDAGGIIIKVDFSHCSMSSINKRQMLKAIPANEELLPEAFQSADTMIVQGDFEISFDDFMREYPYKRNTHLARAYWPKMKKEQQAQAFVAATEYRKFLSKEANSWQKPMISDKWLKTEQYLNDWKTL